MYSKGEEIFSSIVHGIGAGLGVAALVIMIMLCVVGGSNTLDVVGVSIYGSTLIILYTMSTLYHAIPNKTAKKVFQIFDHCSIYLLIAGTFTPLCFSILKDVGTSNWILISVIWSMAIIGIIFYAVFPGKLKVVNVSLYIIMGWSIVFLFPDLIKVLKAENLTSILYWMLAGGIFYTGGVAFYAIKKIKYFHSIWHIFVLFGSVSHFIAIMMYFIK